MDTVDSVIIGAGVVGLALAREISAGSGDVLVLEKEARVATHTSTRNSEVIHAGIYYPHGSLKARLCVEGKELLYRYCAEKNIEHRRTGKLIVACNHQQEERLRELCETGHRNGVADLELLDSRAAEDLEPAIRCSMALLSPSTGVISSIDYAMALFGDVENRGGTVVTGCEVDVIDATGGSFVVRTTDGYSIRCSRLINAAGPWCTHVARKISGLDKALVPEPLYAKGQYFEYTGRSPFRRLIYPMPNEHALGIHATIDVSGALRFGPDVTWVDAINYDVDESAKDYFAEVVSEYFPAVDAALLRPGYAGVRPKVSFAGETAVDFVIQDSRAHGLPGLINLFGLESPALTASLAIARHVGSLLRD